MNNNADTKADLIRQSIGHFVLPDKEYHKTLPESVSGWYCYVKDGGHSILCLLKRNVVQAFEPDENIADFLIPVPVKTVLRDYTIENSFVVVDIEYSAETGLQTNPADTEW
jgi:hypothetical protein